MTFVLGPVSELGITLLAAAQQTSFGEPIDGNGSLGCLGSLLVFSLLSILSFSILKARSFLRRSGKEKADFTSLRSTGKTIVNNASSDDDDSDPPGVVN
jgi:hypothetical protein